MDWPDHSRLDCRSRHIAIERLESAFCIAKQRAYETMVRGQAVEQLLERSSKRAAYSHLWENLLGFLGLEALESQV